MLAVMLNRKPINSLGSRVSPFPPLHSDSNPTSLLSLQQIEDAHSLQKQGREEGRRVHVK